MARRSELARPHAGDRETRQWSLDGVELREDKAAGTVTLAGYASVVESPYDVWGGPADGGWSETIATGAFDKTLRERPDVQLLVNHAGLPLARTKSGTLSLSADNKGLRVAADLDATDPDVMSLRPKVARGDLDEMSFAFRVLRQEWNEDYTQRRILEVNLHRGDVSVVNYGANPATAFAMRRLADRGVRSLADVDPDEDPGALAQAVDAILDEIAKAHAAGDLPTASALLTGAEATVDALLAVLGVGHADDPQAARSFRRRKTRGLTVADARRLVRTNPRRSAAASGGLSLAEARRLAGDHNRRDVR